ncbi:MAG: aminotransferase class III-fold pyridoxal phosphate-dependent enzyme, partial [Cohaesibacteraceae bacterium]|nr:aminotransferase class III-fold pyridoxal phosphate-dependent enzyme [Cohaesibacteraceae bacterium]
LAAVTGRADVMDAAAPGGLGGTYGGNPLSVASANAVLDVIDEEKLCARAEILGSTLIKRLGEIQETTPEMTDIRGVGFMVAAEFRDSDGGPGAKFAARVKLEALKRNLILLTCGIDGNVIRFLAPITIEQDIFDEAMNILDQAIAAARSDLK